jgi:hypothetical protein
VAGASDLKSGGEAPGEVGEPEQQQRRGVDEQWSVVEKGRQQQLPCWRGKKEWSQL